MKKRSILELAVLALVIAVALGVLVGVYFVTAGVSARPQPGALETFVARTVRNLAIGWHAGHPPNPVPNTEAAIAEGRAHFADHCASCHANDGSGDTVMGRGLYPRAPDMRLAASQNLEDHELFYIIENGIRLTGMPLGVPVKRRARRKAGASSASSVISRTSRLKRSSRWKA
jgi:mono/diheme cytochrome c family protein